MSPLAQALAGALVGLSRALSDAPDPTAAPVLLGALEALDRGKEAEMAAALAAVRAEKSRLAPDCLVCPNPCGRTEDYDLAALEDLEPELAQAKLELLKALTACAVRLSRRGGPVSQEALSLLAQGLFTVGYDYLSPAQVRELCAQVQAL